MLHILGAEGLMILAVPPTLLDPNSPVQATIELVEKLSMEAIRGWDGPKTEEGLVRVHEVLHWRLDGYTAELRSVLEGFQLAKRRMDEHIEIMEARGVAIPGDDDEFEEDFGASEEGA
jgi:hypothetical protein